MNVSVTASGDKAAVITQLEGQKPAGHSTLAGGLIDHLVEHIEDLPDDAGNITVSLSAHVGYSVDQAQAAAAPTDDAPTA